MSVLFRALDTGEIITLIGIAVGLALLYMQQQVALQVLNIFMSVLAAIFFLRGYQPRSAANGDGPRPGFLELLAATIVPKVGWIGCAVVTIGILFYLLGLKGTQEMLMIGTLVLTAALALIGLFAIIKPDRVSGLMPLVYRAFPSWLVGLYLYLQ
jgi:hypothetical protein